MGDSEDGQWYLIRIDAARQAVTRASNDAFLVMLKTANRDLGFPGCQVFCHGDDVWGYSYYFDPDSARCLGAVLKSWPAIKVTKPSNLDAMTRVFESRRTDC